MLIGRDVVLWSEDPAVTSREKQLLVLLHGATSDEHDVFDRLTPLLPDGVVVVSPRGPVPEGDGYSWASPQDRTDATSDAEVAAPSRIATRHRVRSTGRSVMARSCSSRATR